MARDFAGLGSASRADAERLSIGGTWAEGATFALVPVGSWIRATDFPQLMASWRNAATASFMTQVEATPANALTYLDASWVGKPDRVFFLIEVYGRTVGHIGVVLTDPDTASIENVMRGEAVSPPGLMTAVFRTLTVWARDTVRLRRLILEVLSSNDAAVQLYVRSGFVEVSRQSLRFDEGREVSRFVEVEAGEANTATMNICMALDLTGTH